MGSQKIPILLNCIAAFLGACGQYYYKKGSTMLAENVFNLPIIIGVALFGIVMVLFVFAYKLGGKISIVYPFYATTFIWGTLIGALIEKEPIRTTQLVGLAFLLLGLTCIAQGIEDL